MKEKTGNEQPEVAASQAAASERNDDAAAAAEDDESNLLHDRSAVGGTVDDNNSNLTMRQRLRLIAALLRAPLLSSAVAVAGNFGITLALFPGVLTEMRSGNKSLDDWSVTLSASPASVSSLTPPTGSSRC
jgi:hypothetical protein